MSFFFFLNSICFWNKWQALAHWLCILNHYCNLLLIPGFFFINSASYINNHGLCEQKQFSLFLFLIFHVYVVCAYAGLHKCRHLCVGACAHTCTRGGLTLTSRISFHWLPTHSLSACMGVVVGSSSQTQILLMTACSGDPRQGWNNRQAAIPTQHLHGFWGC